jgi:hypothetical protein
MLLDDGRPGPRPIEEPLLVGGDLFDREPLDPAGEGGPVGEDELGDDVEVDRVLAPVELVAARDVVARPSLLVR